MKELNNPPPKYKEAYKNLIVFYNEYIDFSNIVINPEGSLQSFTEKFNEKDGSFVNSYDKTKTALLSAKISWQRSCFFMAFYCFLHFELRFL